ncbi:hypothetical protein ACFCZ3_20315 [Cellulosimicrobium cellulans]|uniref:hypothetical protein n=1 Tax=Cellulosimicrobium cellulans TaxID=1710 RepID=UPI0035DE4385
MSTLAPLAPTAPAAPTPPEEFEVQTDCIECGGTAHSNLARTVECRFCLGTGEQTMYLTRDEYEAHLDEQEAIAVSRARRLSTAGAQ